MEGGRNEEKKEDECYGASVEDRLLIQTHVYDEEDKAIRTLTSTCEKKN